LHLGSLSFGSLFSSRAVDQNRRVSGSPENSSIIRAWRELKLVRPASTVNMEDGNVFIANPPELTDEMRELLEKQNSRMISEFKQNQLEKDARKNWDLFYKRNETRFFKNR
jgi:hypothetical protein